MRKLLKGATVALFSMMLLTSCSVLQSEDPIPVYEGKATVIGKEYTEQSELSFFENLFKDPEEIWEVELFIPESSAGESQNIKTRVDQESYDNIIEGRVFCFSNANNTNTFIEGSADIDCEF